MKKAIAMLLLAALLLGCVPGLAEGSGAQEADPTDLLPTLYITAEYSDTTKDGAITGAFLLECRYPKDPSGDASGAPGTVIKIEGHNGITLAEGSPSEIAAGDLPCGGSYSFTLKLKYDETLATERNEQGEITPILTINASSSAIGGCTYSCVFDITPEPRALLLGMNTSPYLLDAYLMQQTISGLSADFERFYYDKQPISISTVVSDISDPGCTGFWESLSTLSAFGADENDVTYLYIDAFTAMENSSPLPGISAIEGGKQQNVLFDEIFAWLGENMKGRVIVLADGRFAGMAVRSFAASGLDPEYYNVVAINTPTAPADTGAQGSPYQGMMARSIAQADEDVYSASTFSYFLNRADIATNEYLLNITGSGIMSYYGGGAANLIFATDPRYDSGVRILAVKEEKCIINTVDALHLYYQYLREIEIPDKGLATTATVITGNPDNGRYCYELTEEGAAGILSAAVCDFDKNGSLDMITVYPHTTFVDYQEYYGPYLREDMDMSWWVPMHFVWDLKLYQIENGRVVCADTVYYPIMFENEFHNVICNGYVHVGESEGNIYIRTTDTWSIAESDNGGGSHTYRVIDGKFVNAYDADPDYDPFRTGFERCLSGDANYTVTDIKADNSRMTIARYYFAQKDYECEYEVVENTNLHAIIAGTAEAKCYEPLVCPDFEAPPVSSGSEVYCEALTSIAQSVSGAAGVTYEYTDHAHQQFTISVSDQYRIKVECDPNGQPTHIDVRSQSGTDEWKDEFQAIYDAILRLPETGLSEEEYAQICGYRMDRKNDFRTANDRVHGQFAFEPMHEDYAILLIYLDQE